jgi:serine/threonine protein kinase
VSDLAQVSGPVDNDLALPPDTPDEVLKYLNKRSPGIKRNAWFLRTRRNGDEVFAFGPYRDKYTLPKEQQGIVTLKTSNPSNRLGQGGYGTVTRGTLLEFDAPRPSREDGLPEPCGGTEWSNVAVKHCEEDDAFWGATVQEALEPGGYVLQVYKILWVLPSREHPRGESLAVMEMMGRDALTLVVNYHGALTQQQPWTRYFNRLSMMIDLAGGLEYAHSQEFSHMDVKLENLMRVIPTTGTTRYEFKIIDWDIAKDLSKEQTSWPTSGTPRYKAPGETKNPNCCR